MSKLDEVRQMYPQYKEVPDDKLADALYRKFYAEKMDKSDYYRQIGFTDSLRKDESGQRIYDLDAAKAQTFNDEGFEVTNLSTYPYIGPALDWAGESVIKGGSKLARGLLSFGADVVGADETGEAIREMIPEVVGGGKGTDVAGTVLQYAVPGAAGVKLASHGAKALGLTGATKYGAQLTGAAAGDLVATNPGEAVTFGDWVGGPTAIEPEDSALERRAKVAAETYAVGPIVDGAIGLGKGIYEFGKGVAGSFTGSELERKLAERLQKMIREMNYDENAIAKNLGEAAARNADPERAGYRPTTGTASGNEALLGVERGISTKPRVIERYRENREALTQVALDAIRTTGDINSARKFFEQMLEGPSREADAALRRAEKLLNEAEKELTARIGSVTSTGTSLDAAHTSGALDATVRTELKALTAEKNRLFQSIDPDKVKPVDQQLFDAMVERVTKPSSAGDIAKIPRAVQRSLEKMQEEGATIGALYDLRGNIRSEISKAQRAGDGVVPQKLGTILDFINKQTEALAQRGDKSAAEAIDFYKNTFAPRFGSVTGAEFRHNVRNSKQNPSQTGQLFLVGPKEGMDQLRKIIDGAADPAQGMQAAKDYIATQLALKLKGRNPQNATQDVHKFIRDYSAALDKFPEIKRELYQTAHQLGRGTKKVNGLTEAVKAAEAKIKKTTKDRNEDAAKYALDQDPVTAVAKAFNAGAEAPARMRALKEMALKDGSKEALRGLREAARKHMKRVLTSPSAGEDVAATVARFNKAFNEESTLATLKEIFTPAEIGRLRAVQNRLNEMARIDSRVTSNSITTQLTQDADNARILLSSMYGIVQGRGVFMMGRWLGDRFRGNRSLKELGERLVEDVMLDPKLAAIMLQRPTQKSKGELRTYIANNYPDMVEDVDQGENEDRPPRYQMAPIVVTEEDQ